MDESHTREQERVAQEQRFRASLITSAAAHVATGLVLVFGPMFLPRDVIMPSVVPVTVLPAASSRPQPDPPAREPEPEEAPEEEPEEPEPIPATTSEPEPVPRSVEDLLREQREEQARLEREAEAERRRREQEEERRRREAEEERRRLEEERRRQPQSAGSRPEPERQSARREGIDVTGTEESQQSFTVEDFPFAAYLRTIRDLVGARWDPPARGEFAPAMRSEVFFRIGRDGQLVISPRVLDGSDNTIYDQAALRAIAAAAPFPPLPREYEGTSLGVRFAFIQE